MALDDDDRAPQHLSDDQPWIRWNWWREDPVEIILLVFILTLFFLLPRPNCGIETKETSVSKGTPASLETSNR